MSSPQKKLGNSSGTAARPAPQPFVPPANASGSLALDVADYLASEISRGVYPVDRKLPSQRDLCNLCNVSDTTVKAALADLVRRDLIEPRDRVGYFVRFRVADTYLEMETRPPTAYHGPDLRWSSPSGPIRDSAAAARPFAARTVQELPIHGTLAPAHTAIASIDVRGEHPAPDIVAILRMTPDPQAPIIARHRLITDRHGTPVELRSSYMPADLVERTALASPAILDGLWPQLIGNHTGRNPQGTRAYVQARMAHDSEAQWLGINAHAMVIIRDLILYPTPDLTGPALDLTRSVLPAETTRIVYPN
jgi:DNA-binding GntR family transcriptional regulator